MRAMSSPAPLCRRLDELAQVPGRFERVDVGQPFTVIVDYAHTDDALRNLTAVAREFLAQRGGPGRVITVFGCGGDRDRSKRPLMGEAAGAGSDFVVLTSDNPRSENPLDIMNDALPGLQRSGTRYTLEPDRAQGHRLGHSRGAGRRYRSHRRKGPREDPGHGRGRRPIRRHRGGAERAAGHWLRNRPANCSRQSHEAKPVARRRIHAGHRRICSCRGRQRLFHRFAHSAAGRSVLRGARRAARRA